MEQGAHKGKLIIVAAPSGAGKTTIVHSLLKALPNHLAFSVSACNREKRSHEVDGKDYYFLTTESFKSKVKNQEFIEWEEVYENNFYGTLRSEIERIWQLKKTVIFDVDVQGAMSIKNQFADQALSIFIKPPNIETLKKRLEKRETETPTSIKRRIEKAALELKFANQFDECILNDNLEEAKSKAYQVVNLFLGL